MKIAARERRKSKRGGTPIGPRENLTLMGIDVGATTIAGGLVTAAGDVLAVAKTPTHRNGPGTAVDTLLDVVDDLLRHAAERQLTLAGIGLGVPGPIDPEKGAMVKPPEYHPVPELADHRLGEQILARTGIPAFVDNDANALALGEWTFGVARGAASLVLLAVGTNVGGGIIHDRRVVRGHSGFAGELGHVPINFDGPLCFCGGKGCLGMYLGGAQMALEAQRRVDRLRASMLLTLAGGDVTAINSQIVFEAARGGDPVARVMVDEACEALAASLGGIVNSLNPEVVVVTGGVAESLVPLERDILQRTRRYAYSPAFAGTRINISATDKRRTMRGAAALVLYELGRQGRREP
jgi:glucokinase